MKPFKTPTDNANTQNRVSNVIKIHYHAYIECHFPHHTDTHHTKILYTIHGETSAQTPSTATRNPKHKSGSKGQFEKRGELMLGRRINTRF